MADKYPVAVFHFKVTIDGSEIAFSEVSGLNQEAQHLEYRHGNAKEFVTMKRVGMIKTGEITMKRGILSGGSEVLDVFKKIYEQKYYSQDSPIPLQIQLLDEKGSPVCTWDVEKAVPVKMGGADLKSDQNQIALESITFQHEGIKASF